MSTASTTAFAGFPREGLEFLEGLAADNSREYFDIHRDTYQSALLQPTKELPRAGAAARGVPTAGKGCRRRRGRGARRGGLAEDPPRAADQRLDPADQPRYAFQRGQ